MCGGMGSRLITSSKTPVKKNIEKPLLLLNHKPLIQYIIETLFGSNKQFKLFAAVSSNTKKTEEFISIKYSKKITIIKTQGNGFSKDLSCIIKYFKSNYQIKEQEKQIQQQNQLSDSSRIIFLPADLPLLSINTIERIAELRQETPLTSIVINKKIIEENGFNPTLYSLRIDKEVYCYTGISVIDLTYISNDNRDLDYSQIKETPIVMNNPEIAFNINTFKDLKRTEEYPLLLKRIDQKEL